MDIEVIRTADGLNQLRDQWDHLLQRSVRNEIFLTHDWQTCWWETFGDQRRLLVIVVRDETGTIRGIAPFYLEGDTGQCVARLIGGTDVSDYLDIIVEAGHERQVLGSVLSYLDSSDRDWDILDLHCVRENSASLKVIPEFASRFGWKTEMALEEYCPVIALPNDWEEYLAGLDKKDRHELRRKMRRLENMGDSPRFYEIIGGEDLDQAVSRFLSLHRASAQSKMHFMTRQMETFFRRITALLLDRGWLKLWFLDIGGSPVAGVLAFDYNGNIQLYNSGYNPDYSQLSVGVVLLAYAIRESIAHGKREFDFLRGSESYKYDFGAKDTNIYSLLVVRSHTPCGPTSRAANRGDSR